jgi:predicted dehydrogenase
VVCEEVDGRVTSLEGETLTDAAAALLETGTNADVAFVRAVAAGSPAHPGFGLAVRAQTIADACYRSAAQDGATLPV